MSNTGKGDDGGDEDALDIFQEPEGYFKPKAPFSFTTFELDDGRSISLRLVGESALWAHHLWNGAKGLSDHLQQNAKTLVESRSILELGAGAGLPSLVCALLGAKHVCMTDYPDPELIENMQYNISHCLHLPDQSYTTGKRNIIAMGYLWGADVGGLLEPLLINDTLPSTGGSSCTTQRFETILLADILYNHSEHHKLVHTVRATLARTAAARALVFFTPYRPWLLERDMVFFDLVKNSTTSSEVDNSSERMYGDKDDGKNAMLGVEQVCEKVLPNPMFENDRGDEKLRRTVFGYEIFWADLRA